MLTSGISMVHTIRSAWRSRAMRWLLGTVCVSLSWSGLAQSQAVQFDDGRTMFESPPRLVSFFTYDRYTNDRDATYYVTVGVPEDAGEPLKTLQVSLREGRFTRLDYHINELEVFRGSQGDRQSPLQIEAADYEDETQRLLISLVEAVEPGQQVTFALRPVRNPSRGGVYLFDIFASPAGSDPVPQRVGIGRLNIYRPDGRDPFD